MIIVNVVIPSFCLNLSLKKDRQSCCNFCLLRQLYFQQKKVVLNFMTIKFNFVFHNKMQYRTENTRLDIILSVFLLQKLSKNHFFFVLFLFWFLPLFPPLLLCFGRLCCGFFWLFLLFPLDFRFWEKFRFRFSSHFNCLASKYSKDKR